MDEMLPRLFSQGRIRRPQIRYQPFQGFDGPVQGMRGSMPANALDTQAMNDVAQGIDIGSVAPTRLQAGQIDPEAFAAGDAGQPGQGGATGAAPIVLASNPSSQQGRICIDGKCYRTGDTLPDGSVFVGESPAQAGGIAATAPAATVGGQRAAAAPAGQAQQNLVAGLDMNKPSTFFDLAQQQLNMANQYAASRLPYQTQLASDIAVQAMQNGMTAAVYLKKEALAAEYRKLAERQMGQRDTALQIERDKVDMASGAARESVENKVRLNRSQSAATRAQLIVDSRIADFAKNGVNLQKDRATMIDQEEGVITGMDLSHYVSALADATEAVRSLRAAGAQAGQLQRAEAAYSSIRAEVVTRLRDRYGKISDPDQRAKVMHGELMAPYEEAFRSHLDRTGQKADPREAISRASLAVRDHISRMDQFMADDPYAGVFQTMTGPQAQPPAGPQQAPQSPAGGIITSGSGMGPSGTMSLAR